MLLLLVVTVHTVVDSVICTCYSYGVEECPRPARVRTMQCRCVTSLPFGDWIVWDGFHSCPCSVWVSIMVYCGKGEFWCTAD
jgi:hypothetical protein